MSESSARLPYGPWMRAMQTGLRSVGWKDDRGTAAGETAVTASPKSLDMNHDSFHTFDPTLSSKMVNANNPSSLSRSLMASANMQ